MNSACSWGLAESNGEESSALGSMDLSSLLTQPSMSIWAWAIWGSVWASIVVCYYSRLNVLSALW